MIASITHFFTVNEWSYDGSGIGKTRDLKPGGVKSVWGHILLKNASSMVPRFCLK